MPNIEKVCEICGESFSVRPSRIMQKYCSNHCRGVAITKRVERTCQTCGKIFSLCPSQIKRGKGKYCSRECHNQAGRVERICEHCGINFIARASNVRNGKDKYCGAKCYGASQRLEVGENARGWKGGKITVTGGYVAVKVPWRKSAKADGYMLEHRKVMEDALGRHLRGDEVVHHANGDKQDNRIANLMILSNREHTLLHARI